MTMRNHIPYAPGQDEWGYTWISRTLDEVLDTIRGYTMAGWQLITWDKDAALWNGEVTYTVLFVEKDEYIKPALQGKHLTHAQ